MIADTCSGWKRSTSVGRLFRSTCIKDDLIVDVDGCFIIVGALTFKDVGEAVGEEKATILREGSVRVTSFPHSSKESPELVRVVVDLVEGSVP